ncbi:MAG: polyprenyl synthetase family protein [Bacteroidia bacterium]|nr:polyprenyl synthetase family protein [Bacteroidia bacterium]
MKDPQQIRKEFELYLQGIEPIGGGKHALYEPMYYILGLRAKRIRPLLALLTYQAAGGGNPARAFSLAAGLELFHNFSLIHDDIMDNAPMRRGMPTVHEKWDQTTAILSGDALFALSVAYLTRDFPQHASTLINEYARISLGVCEGQLEDMALAANEKATIEDYLEMIRKKTAMLIGGAMSLGAIAAGARPERVEMFYEFGESMGIGFQLHDDYLDVYAERAKFGKQVAGDIIENKKTFLLLKAMELADESQSKKLKKLLEKETDPEKKVKGVMKIYAELNIEELTKEKMNHYFEEARTIGEALSRLEGFEFLQEFLDALAQREY